MWYEISTQKKFTAVKQSSFNSIIKFKQEGNPNHGLDKLRIRRRCNGVAGSVGGKLLWWVCVPKCIWTPTSFDCNWIALAEAEYVDDSPSCSREHDHMVQFYLVANSSIAISRTDWCQSCWYRSAILDSMGEKGTSGQLHPSFFYSHHRSHQFLSPLLCSQPPSSRH